MSLFRLFERLGDMSGNPASFRVRHSASARFQVGAARAWRLLLTPLFLTLLFALPARADFQTMDIEDVDAATGTVEATEPWGINNGGDIVGEFSDVGFVRNALGTYTPLAPVPGAASAIPYDINDAGHIAGTFVDLLGLIRGYYYDGTTFTTIEGVGTVESHAYGINNFDQVTGAISDGSGIHGYIYDPVGGITIVDFPGATETTLSGINDSGVVVGHYVDALGGHGFLFDGTTFSTIDHPLFGDTMPLDINNSNQIVGQVDDVNNGHGFLYDAGQFYDITRPEASLLLGGTEVTGINDAGDIVGHYENDFMESHGFLIPSAKASAVQTDLGLSITVSPMMDLSLNFAEITVAGTTTVTTSTAGPKLPGGFVLEDGLVHDISTTATFTGPAEVCFSYNDAGLTNEADLEILHYSGTRWDNITETGYPDTVANVVCGLTSGFSPFIIGTSAKTVLVRLAAFSAKSDGNAVAFSWSTAAEIDNAGFNVLRAPTADGPYTVINDAMIPAKGNAAEGAVYDYVDGSVEPAASYWYVLEDVDNTGFRTQHGPLTITVQPGGSAVYVEPLREAPASGAQDVSSSGGGCAMSKAPTTWGDAIGALLVLFLPLLAFGLRRRSRA